MFQLISGIILLTRITSKLTIQASSNKAIPPHLIKVIALDTDDEVVQNDADASPHDDDHVAPRVDKLNTNFFE
jgi:hypothetical protein